MTWKYYRSAIEVPDPAASGCGRGAVADCAVTDWMSSEQRRGRRGRTRLGTWAETRTPSGPACGRQTLLAAGGAPTGRVSRLYTPACAESACSVQPAWFAGEPGATRRARLCGGPLTSAAWFQPAESRACGALAAAWLLKR